MSKEFQHQSVLLEEAIDALAVKGDGIYIDATLGRGGHSRAILDRLNESGKLIAIDKDPEAIKIIKQQWGDDPRVTLLHDSFTCLEEIVEKQKLKNKISGILLDLGVSSPQLDDPRRGFSFLQEGELDMRMNNTQGQTAAEWIASAKEAEIANVLYEYGEERFSRRIAKAIVKQRQESPIVTTTQLAAIVSAANPAWEKHKHPATRTFQAIRIFINQELKELEIVMEQAVRVLAAKGRLAVISFHSLEDRIVKRFIRRHSQGEIIPREVPVMSKGMRPLLRTIGRGIKPTDDEIARNPRSRSAVLRVAEKSSEYR